MFLYSLFQFHVYDALNSFAVLQQTYSTSSRVNMWDNTKYSGTFFLKLGITYPALK